MIGRLSDSILERARSEAQLREFVADASHELRTPLTTVLGYAQLHRKGAIAGKDLQADAWARTEAEASRMKRLVEDMLELARFDAEPQLRRGRIDAKQLVSEVLTDADRAHPDVTFALGHGPVAADVEAPVMVTADSDRLRQAVINVVNNAAHHGAAHVTATVATVERDEGEKVRIDVADDGPGMTPEIAARATERFVRGDSSRSRSTGGAGLGLAITAAIVDAHEGKLEIASELGKGTTVSIEIPA
jgi:two-component system OmpR family sensor kinase